jgi:hypothetical protein
MGKRQELGDEEVLIGKLPQPSIASVFKVLSDEMKVHTSA